MRRNDREVKDIQDILAIIDKCDSCNLGLSLNDVPYIVPLNFGYTYEDSKLSLFFHGAKEGKKHDLVAQNSNAAFSMDCGHELLTGKSGCAYSMFYESVAGAGTIKSLTDVDEKHAGLLAIMRHYSPEREFEFSDTEIGSVSVLKLSVCEFTGKRHQK